MWNHQADDVWRGAPAGNRLIPQPIEPEIFVADCCRYQQKYQHMSFDINSQNKIASSSAAGTAHAVPIPDKHLCASDFGVRDLFELQTKLWSNPGRSRRC
jgi:hypothetical protein